MNITVFCDGSYNPTSGKAGVGAVIQFAGTSSNVSEALSEDYLDNNIVELKAIEFAIIKALEVLKKCSIQINAFDLIIHTDSASAIKYVTLEDESLSGHISSITVNIKKELKQFKTFKLEWIKGHSGHSNPKTIANGMADRLARKARGE